MRVRKTSEDRKAEIVQAALAIAFEVGPERVTTGMIAKRLGLTQPAIYKHFPSKNDIWRSIAYDLSAQVTANIDNAKERGGDPVERLRRLVLGHLKLVLGTPALPEIMVTRDPEGIQTPVRQVIRSGMTDFANALATAIEEAQDIGSIRAEVDAKDLAMLILGMIQSLVLRMMVTRDPSILLKDGSRLLELQLSAFAQKGEGS